MLLSRFSHLFDLGENVALYSSLRMKPVFLSKNVYSKIEKLLSNMKIKDENIPLELKTEVNELKKQKIIISEPSYDDKILEFVRSKIPVPQISVCYFILSEQCNLACKYCFLGNNNSVRRSNFKKSAMTKETAEKALQFFITQLKKNLTIENLEPTIIFYGGEPLINFETLEYVAQRVKELKEIEPCLKKINLSCVTNGLLLTKEKLLKMKELDVGIGISVDGCDEKSNAMRIDIHGNPVFNKIINTLDIAKECGVDISLSVTLTEESIKSKDAILNLVKKYGIKGFGFNILMNSDELNLSPDYYENAAQFLVDCFTELRKLGIYEDRVMRKLKAFSKAQVYYSDCAAQSGAQLVFTPDESIGICHGCLAERKYFISNLDDKDFEASNNEIFKEWSTLSPVNKNKCLDCEALGICGGGCPIDAVTEDGKKDIHGIDKRFCIHTKKTLEFLIQDLYRIIREDGNKK